MFKTIRTIFAAAFILLLAGGAVVSAADQPATDAQAAQTQVVETVTVTSAVVPAAQAPLIELAKDHREECGDVLCPPNFECCNPLEGICVRPGEACIL